MTLVCARCVSPLPGTKGPPDVADSHQQTRSTAHQRLNQQTAGTRIKVGQ